MFQQFRLEHRWWFALAASVISNFLPRPPPPHQEEGAELLSLTCPLQVFESEPSVLAGVQTLTRLRTFPRRHHSSAPWPVLLRR